ncbi:MAG: hypothetical protein E1N59_1641 [Puniceicoccaceae bacterium 5H]|nr:MAG: hypothetical protein E1N59_1641 [Puniceicoccaceae bacterium 5H]
MMLTPPLAAAGPAIEIERGKKIWVLPTLGLVAALGVFILHLTVFVDSVAALWVDAAIAAFLLTIAIRLGWIAYRLYRTPFARIEDGVLTLYDSNSFRNRQLRTDEIQSFHLEPNASVSLQLSQGRRIPVKFFGLEESQQLLFIERLREMGIPSR